jgi:hypothetical protein
MDAFHAITAAPELKPSLENVKSYGTAGRKRSIDKHIRKRKRHVSSLCDETCGKLARSTAVSYLWCSAGHQRRGRHPSQLRVRHWQDRAALPATLGRKGIGPRLRAGTTPWG